MKRILLLCWSLFAAVLFFVPPADAAETVYAAVIVDVAHALSSDDIGGNVYLFDSTGYNASGKDGQKLTTTVTPGDTIEWSVKPIDPDNTVTISNFTGSAIGKSGGTHIVDPAKVQKYKKGSAWRGKVYAPSDGADPYTIELILNGTKGSFDAYLISNAPPPPPFTTLCSSAAQQNLSDSGCFLVESQSHAGVILTNADDEDAVIEISAAGGVRACQDRDCPIFGPNGDVNHTPNGDVGHTQSSMSYPELTEYSLVLDCTASGGSARTTGLSAVPVVVKAGRSCKFVFNDDNFDDNLGVYVVNYERILQYVGAD